MSEDRIQEVLSEAYTRMHTYTCAESSLQALLQLWEIPDSWLTWATAGYLGAIMSGETTCGLLVGSTAAIGFKCGLGNESAPEVHPSDRGTAVEAVGELYRSFIDEFGSTTCKTLSNVDFSDGEQLADYIVNQRWKNTCDRFLEFVIRKCLEMDEKGKI
ncbi:C_GCAxxG_C_C family protein [Candidatus Thorarchaeota archaeon]|nr:MAG: C_GCAxxG_C_C family protein [Candidatus Thorarchaeota archaeon]